MHATSTIADRSETRTVRPDGAPPQGTVYLPGVLIRSRRVVRLLWLTAVTLAAVSFAAQCVASSTDSEAVAKLAKWIDVDSEGNLPTWFATMLLAGSSGLCYLIGRSRAEIGTTTSRQWLGLSLVMLFMCIDEAASIHEKVGLLMEPLHLSGPFYFAWVIPWSALVLVVGMFFWQFLWQLPSIDRWNIILAGCVFVGGALGVEFIEGLVASAQSETDLRYELIATLQEVTEMIGIILFIRAVLLVLSRVGGLRLRVAAG